MNQPFKPTLYSDPVVPMDYFPWDRMHVWIHKPPLFLWQIALSFHLFGVSEFTLRLPSVFLSVVYVLIIFRTGKLLVNRTTGIFSGVLFLSTPYMLELIAGRQELEHNDLAFMVYVSISVWSWIEYYFSGKKYWIVLIGLFSGMAILTKWLPGLLVFLGWFIVKAQNKTFSLKGYKDVLIALAITISISLPWQLYVFIRFPEEAWYALSMNSSHFLTALEGHKGDFWYHLNQFSSIYGVLAPFLVLPSFYLLYRKMQDKKLFFVLLFMVLFVYFFFSLAKTKMPSFPIIVSMILFISFGTLLDSIQKYIEQRHEKRFYLKWITLILIIAFLAIRFDVENFQKKHTTWKNSNVYTKTLSTNKEIFQSLKLPSNSVLTNVKGRHYIEAMFYTGFPAYSFVPDEKQYRSIKEKKRVPVIFVTPGLHLPEYILKDSSVILINRQLQGYQ